MTILAGKWTIGVEKLNRPSSDFQIHSICDEILVFNGTSINDVLGDWCDVLSFNLSSEGSSEPTSVRKSDQNYPWSVWR